MGKQFTAYPTAPIALHVLVVFYASAMPQLDPARLSAIILNAPTWAQLGLALRDPRLRERAADALAAVIVQRLEVQEREVDDGRQLRLPI